MAADFIPNTMTKVDGRSLFGNVPMLRGVSDSIVDALYNHGRPQMLTKGQVLYLQDDPGDYYYLIISGWVKLFRETLEGEEAVIDVLTTGHVFGESSLFDQGIQTASAMSVDSTSVMAFPTSTLSTALEENSEVAMSMLNALSHYRRQQSREIESLTLQNAAQRIGCFLLRLLPSVPEEESFTIHLPYDKSLIAARLGMKSETFSRALARLKKEASLGVRGASIMVPSLTQLSSYCCSACSSEFPCQDRK